jgi:hypothetical protein
MRTTRARAYSLEGGGQETEATPNNLPQGDSSPKGETDLETEAKTTSATEPQSIKHSPIGRNLAEKSSQREPQKLPQAGEIRARVRGRE